MLVIRLMRIGKKNRASFRIVVTQKTAAPQSGSFLEVLGSYNPGQNLQGGRKIQLKSERIKYWLSQGAQTSITVHNLLVKAGLIKGPKIKKKITPKKKKQAESVQKEAVPEAQEPGDTEKEEKSEKELPKKTDSTQKDKEESVPQTKEEKKEKAEEKSKDEVPSSKG